jgi:hypothetical protein
MVPVLTPHLRKNGFSPRYDIDLVSGFTANPTPICASGNQQKGCSSTCTCLFDLHQAIS